MAKVYLIALLFVALFFEVKSSVIKVNDGLENRVTGGTKASPSVAKFTISLLIEFDRITKICGGYLYLLDEIYTAANCVFE